MHLLSPVFLVLYLVEVRIHIIYNHQSSALAGYSDKDTGETALDIANLVTKDADGNDHWYIDSSRCRW